MNRPTLCSLTPRSRVLRLVLERRSSELSLNLRLREIDSDRVLEITFGHVSDLRFRRPPTLSEIVLLLSENVSSFGLERLHYRIKDAEEEFISFWCETIERDADDAPE